MKKLKDKTHNIYIYRDNESIFEPDYLLNEKYESINKIRGLKTSLYAHQKTAVKAMLELENNRVYNFNYRKNNIESERLVVKTNSGVLSYDLRCRVPHVRFGGVGMVSAWRGLR